MTKTEYAAHLLADPRCTVENRAQVAQVHLFDKCAICIARLRQVKRNAQRKMHDQIHRDLGLSKRQHGWE